MKKIIEKITGGKSWETTIAGATGVTALMWEELGRAFDGDIATQVGPHVYVAYAALFWWALRTRDERKHRD